MTFADPAAIEEHIAANLTVLPGGKADRVRIQATPYVYRVPSEIPPREYVYGRHFVRGFISGTLAPGGVGKSTQALCEAVAMVTGRDLLGVKVREPLRVWYWNGEDPLDEIERKTAAILLHFGIAPAELADRLFINSGRDCEIVIASETKDGAVVAEPVMDDLEATIRDQRIDVFIFDPFVSCHEVSENDNNKIGRVMKALALLADRTNSAGDMVHHVRKSQGASEITVEDGRGAKAFIDRVRSARTLNPMTREEAEKFGVEPNDCAKHFRVNIGKANLFPATAQAAWRKMESVALGNGRNGGPGDFVGVVTLWKPPNAFKGVSAADLLRIQKLVDQGSYRESILARDWVGKAVAEVLGWDPTDTTAKHTIKEQLRTWFKNDLFKIEDRPDSNRELRPFVVVGKWAQV